MKTAIAAAAVSCLIGAAGLGSAAALAGSERAAWPCSERPQEKHCKKQPSTETITQTLPGETVTTPASTIELPPQTVTLTVTTPAPPPTTVTVTSPAETVTVTTKVKAKPPAKKAAKPKKHKKKARQNVGGRQAKPPHSSSGGVTG